MCVYCIIYNRYTCNHTHQCHRGFSATTSLDVAEKKSAARWVETVMRRDVNGKSTIQKCWDITSVTVLGASFHLMWVKQS